MESLRVGDAAAAAVQKTPHRVGLDSMLAKIAGEYYTTLAAAHASMPTLPGMDTMTLCTLVMQNGFIVIGKAAPADPANFSEELGRRFAREDAIRQLWPLEGYALRERMSAPE